MRSGQDRPRSRPRRPDERGAGALARHLHAGSLAAAVRPCGRRGPGTRRRDLVGPRRDAVGRGPAGGVARRPRGPARLVPHRQHAELRRLLLGPGRHAVPRPRCRAGGRRRQQRGRRDRRGRADLGRDRARRPAPGPRRAARRTSRRRLPAAARRRGRRGLGRVPRRDRRGQPLLAPAGRGAARRSRTRRRRTRSPGRRPRSRCPSTRRSRRRGPSTRTRTPA